MATTIQPPTNGSKYFMNLNPQVSPPEQYFGNAAMPQTPPSNNVSPTNHHQSPIHVRQIRSQRTPIYLPAALRPPETQATDIPKRPQAPDTPPASQDSSFNSKDSASGSANKLNVSFSQAGGDEDPEASLHLRLSKSCTSETLSCILDPVTGPPTTAHWKPDASASCCAVCHATFTWFFRRHHCRHCGDVVCDAHSQRTVPLDQNARFHPEGERSKSCDVCVKDWEIVMRIRRSRAGSVGSGSMALPIPQQARSQQDAMRVGSMARSEGGMVWSTF